MINPYEPPGDIEPPRLKACDEDYERGAHHGFLAGAIFMACLVWLLIFL